MFWYCLSAHIKYFSHCTRRQDAQRNQSLYSHSRRVSYNVEEILFHSYGLLNMQLTCCKHMCN